MVASLINRSKELLKNEHKSILSAAVIIGASFLSSALLGLVRNHLLAARFFGGLEGDLDVYFAAFVIPDTIFQLLVVGAVSAAFIPVFQSYVLRGKEEGRELANASLTTVGLVLSLISVLILIFARPLAGIIAHFSPDKLDLMANLIRIMSVAQLLFTLSAFLTGILQAQRRFLIPAIAPLLYNLGTIIGILLFSSRFGIYSAAIGVVLGALFHVAIQLPLAKHLGFSPALLFKPNHPGVRSITRLMPPRMLALGLDQVERWVAVNLASLMVPGSLSIFSFARQLYALPVSLFGVSLSQASFPTLSQEANNHDKTKFKATLSKSILEILFFALPASVLVLVLRIPLVRIAFGARNFPWEATLLTGRALALLSLSIAPLSISQILVRSFHALKNTRTPLYVGASTMIIFISSSYFITNRLNLGILGITFAMSLANLLDFILLYLFLRRQIGGLAVGLRGLKMIAATIFTGISLWIPMRLLDRFVFDTTRTIPLVILTLIVSTLGFSVYLLFSKILRIEELGEVFRLAKKLGNWRHILVKSDEVIEPSPNGH